MGVLVCGTHETGRGEAAIGEGGAALDKRDIGMGMDGVVRRVRGGQEPCRQVCFTVDICTIIELAFALARADRKKA